MLAAMSFSPMRFTALSLFMGLTLITPARAEGTNCIVSRGNLCFPTGCDNSAKNQRMILDFAAGTLRMCPSRFTEAGCSDVPMSFDIRDNAIIGITREGEEFSARAVYLNRVTGALTSTQVNAGGIAAVDFGSCEVRR